MLELPDSSPVREVLLGLLEEGDTVVGNQVSQVVLVVIVTMLDLLAIEVERVVVEARVTYEPHPLCPARRDVSARVLVQVLAKVACEK